MKTLKKFRNYILMVIGMALFTYFLVFVGLNSDYKAITLNGELPSQISIEKAEANKKQVRVYGYVKNSEQNDLNGKYINVSVYNTKNEKIDTQFLKIENAVNNQDKLFKAYFNVNDAAAYEISIVDRN